MIAVVCSVAGFAIPACADVAENLAAADKMMRNGAHVKAIEIVNASLESTDISSQLAGKALLIRAQSHEKLGKVAYALADYDRALWMEGLSAADKKAAEEGRVRVENSLGIKEERAAETRPTQVASSDTFASSSDEPAAEASPPPPPPPVVKQPAPKPQQAAEAPPKPATPKQPPQQAVTVNAAVVPEPRPRQKPKQEEDGITNFFNNLFGSSESEEQKPPPRKAVAAAQPRRTAPPAVQQTRSFTPTPQAPASTGSIGAGSFAIQFAALYEEEKALAEVNRIGRKFGGELNGRSPSMLIVPTKDGGTLYKVVAGPFPKEESVATCESLKLKKLNCMVITHKQ